MVKITIKKELYKQKTIANITHIKGKTVYYETLLDDGTMVFFEVPIDDMGGAEFKAKEHSRLLNRWIHSYQRDGENLKLV